MHRDIVMKEQYALVHLADTIDIPRCPWMIEETLPCEILHSNRDSAIIHDW